MLRIALSAISASLLALSVSPAHAQATRTWVSGVGDDANPCSRTAPCKTFPGAISKTAASGEINCLDPGGFGSVTITKSIIINCEMGTAGVLAALTNGINVNGAGIIVVLKGLDIQGAGNGLIGINFIAGAVLHVQKCIIRQFNGGSATGILFAPNSAGAKLFVDDCYVADNGSGSSGGGILIQPAVGGTAVADLTNVRINNNSNGVRAIGTNGSVKLSMRNSTSSGNTFGGVVAITTGNPVTAIVESSTISHNGGNGLNANGGGALLNFGRSLVTGNAISAASSNGGVIQSYGDNDIDGNTANNLPTVIAHH